MTQVANQKKTNVGGGGTTNSKWFLQDLGHQGLNNLLAAYPDDKGARAVCTFGYSPGPGHEPILFQGITNVRFFPSPPPPRPRFPPLPPGLLCPREGGGGTR